MMPSAQPLMPLPEESGVGRREPHRLEIVQWRTAWHLPSDLAAWGAGGLGAAWGGSGFLGTG